MRNINIYRLEKKVSIFAFHSRCCCDMEMVQDRA